MPMRKSAKWFLGLSAIGLVVAAVLGEPDKGNPGGASDNDTLDYSKPIFSVEGMTTCQDVSAFSKIISDLHDHFTPKYAEYGCRTWPDGIPVTVISKIAAYRHVEFANIDGTRVSDFTVYTMLRNEGSATTAPPALTSPAPAPPAAENPAPTTPSPADTDMPNDIKRAIAKFDEANDICRDAVENAQAACDLRDNMMENIKAKGWCWNVADRAESDGVWSRCPTTP